MLNYVWLALLFLGIASALFVDISDISNNTYKNNVPLSAAVQMAGAGNDSNFGLELKITPDNYKKFSDSQEKSEIIIKGVGSFSSDKKINSVISFD